MVAKFYPGIPNYTGFKCRPLKLNYFANIWLNLFCSIVIIFTTSGANEVDLMSHLCSLTRAKLHLWPDFKF